MTGLRAQPESRFLPTKTRWLGFAMTTLAALALAMIGSVVTPQKAEAQIAAVGPCNSFDFSRSSFQDNECLAAYGTPGFAIFGGSGSVCVVPAGSPNPGPGGADASAGGCNAIGSSPTSLVEIPFWLPPTTPGTYDVWWTRVDGGQSVARIVITSSGGAAPTVNVAEIKKAAGKQKNRWRSQANWGANLSDNATAFSLGWALATGDVVGVAAGAFGLITGLPTDYNGGVLTVGGKVIAALAGGQADRYRDLEADPPDPNFTDFVPVDLAAVNAQLAADAALYPGIPLTYPFTAETDDPLHLAQIQLANEIAQEQAMVFAFMRTFEKFQGAEAAGDDEFTFLQARAVRDYANMLRTQLGDTRSSLVTYRDELNNDGLGGVSYDGADLAALINRLETSGLTPDERADLESVGFNQTDIDLLFARIAAFPAETGTFSRTQGIDDLITSIDEMDTAFSDAADEAQDVMDFFESSVTITHPDADAGGPYNGVEGASVAFDGSGSTTPSGSITTYEWDFDLDGSFDDGAGVSPSFTFATPGEYEIGLKVTNSAGLMSIAYAQVTITEANSPPAVTVFLPASLTPTASALSPLNFSVSASDPDGDTPTFEWTVDGTPVSTASSFVFTPAPGATGVAVVRVKISDGNSLSPDVFEQRVVELIAEVATPNVVGLSQAAAQSAITNANLTVGSVTTANSDTVPVGDVISQNPAAGSVVTEGASVDLVVSTGPANVNVPDVTGQNQFAASSALTGAGLTVGNVTSTSSPTAPAGTVISQNPAAGSSVAPGTAVDLVLSSGPAPVNVPDVTGLSQSSASAALTGAGLAVGNVTSASSDTVPAGDVISQNPAGGSSVAPGTAVDLVVSSGPAPVNVPDVTGLSQSSASAALTGAGLAVGNVTNANSNTVPAGDVISQNPAGGSSVAPGTAVDLVLSSGPAPVNVPDVTGLSQS
ncbi:MAG: PASTA domain-containing protein, partial [Pseudomonadota bacterium]